MRYHIRDKDVLTRCLVDIGNLPYGQFDVTISKKNRSLQQNNLWHKCVQVMSDETGYTPPQMKYLIKEAAGLIEEFQNKKTGEIIKMVRSSADLNKEEFSKLMDKTYELAAKAEINIPSGNYFGIE